jgi:hypothetical protein
MTKLSKPEKDARVKLLIDGMESRKGDFLHGIEQSIVNYVKAQSIGRCLTIVERDGNGGIHSTYAFNLANHEYLKRLASFMRRQPHNGYTLDSALTDPIVKVVSQQFEALFAGEGGLIAEIILRDGALSRQIVHTLIHKSEALKFASGQAKSRAVDYILHHIGEQIGTGLVLKVSAAVGASAAFATAKYIAVLIVKHFGVVIAKFMVKFLAVPAVSKVIALIVGKFAVAAILGGVIKFVAVKFGITATAATFWVLAPLVALWLAWDLSQFPTHLGEQVAKEVATELGANYHEISHTLAEQIVENLGEISVDKISEALLGLEEMEDQLAELLDTLT